MGIPGTGMVSLPNAFSCVLLDMTLERQYMGIGDICMFSLPNVFSDEF